MFDYDVFWVWNVNKFTMPVFHVAVELFFIHHTTITDLNLLSLHAGQEFYKVKLQRAALPS